MITERDVKWPRRACLAFDNCLMRNVRDDEVCRSYHPDGRYIEAELRRLNQIEEDRLRRERAKELGVLPCPFCGGSATIRCDYEWVPHFRVSCDDIMCCGHVIEPGGLDPHDEKEAVAKWNKRPPRTKIGT